MISKELQGKLLLLFREVGIMKLMMLVMVLGLGWQLLNVLQVVQATTTLTKEGYFIAVVLTCNMLLMCMMYFCYMYDHIFASIRKVFPDE